MKTQYHISSLTPNNKLSLMLVMIIGFLPVTSIALHCIGIISLSTSLFALIIPAFFFTIIVSLQNSVLAKVILFGWLAGMLAVFCYDLTRIPYMLLGWGDFIPRIGGWVKNSNETDAFIGYLWRYIGNGGFLGISFFVLVYYFKPKGNIIVKGTLFGVFIFASLISILLLFEKAQLLMFKVNLLSFYGSLTGHLMFGLVLGLLAKKFFFTK